MSDQGTETAARALRAMRSLAGDLAQARREAALLRRENTALRAEIERLGAGTKHARSRASQPAMD